MDGYEACEGSHLSIHQVLLEHCLSKLYAKTREIVAAEVKSAEFLAATTDMWSALHELYGAHHGRRLDAEDPMVADPLPSTRPHR